MKIFNKEGNAKFISLMKEFLKTLDYPENYKNKYEKLFEDLIKQEKYLVLLAGSNELKKMEFENRFDFGKHVYGVLQNCSFSKINRNSCVWNYITCYYLKHLLSSSRKENRLIFMPKWRDTKRNLARTPWLLYYINRENSLFALCNPLNQHSNMCEQYVSRQELLRNSSVGKLCMKLYYNPKTKKLRKNAAKHEKDDKLDGWHPGVIYPRLTASLGKLYKIYDLWSLKDSDLENLIGKEFSHWSKTN